VGCTSAFPAAFNGFPCYGKTALSVLHKRHNCGLEGRAGSVLGFITDTHPRITTNLAKPRLISVDAGSVGGVFLPTKSLGLQMPVSGVGLMLLQSPDHSLHTDPILYRPIRQGMLPKSVHFFDEGAVFLLQEGRSTLGFYPKSILWLECCCQAQVSEVLTSAPQLHLGPPQCRP
jgi:hypothetical protein